MGPRVLTSALLTVILLLNTQRCFGAYADGLPDHNVPFGRLIADYLQGLPEDTHAYIIGCCWANAGRPEPKGITQPWRRTGGVRTHRTLPGHVRLRLDVATSAAGSVGVGSASDRADARTPIVCR